MSRGSDIDGLLAVAIRDEQSGSGFYRSLSQLAASAEVTALFADLSEQEKTHEARFKELAEKLEESNTPFQYEDEYAGYVQALVAEGGSSAVRDDVESCTDDTERLTLAIRFEREQLSLQQDLGRFIGSEYQDIVKTIIDEERGHVVRLSTAKEKIGS